MSSRWFLRIAPFLFVDGFLGLAVLLFLRLDWIVNNTLYGYGLSFSVDWAIPYWETMRLGLGLLCSSIIALTFAGYASFRMMKKEREEATVFICKSCGKTWAVLSHVSKVSGQLPRFKALRSCASCNKELLTEK